MVRQTGLPNQGQGRWQGVIIEPELSDDPFNLPLQHYETSRPFRTFVLGFTVLKVP